MAPSSSPSSPCGTLAPHLRWNESCCHLRHHRHQQRRCCPQADPSARSVSGGPGGCLGAAAPPSPAVGIQGWHHRRRSGLAGTGTTADPSPRGCTWGSGGLQGSLSSWMTHWKRLSSCWRRLCPARSHRKRATPGKRSVVEREATESSRLCRKSATARHRPGSPLTCQQRVPGSAPGHQHLPGSPLTCRQRGWHRGAGSHQDVP